ncbi:MAG: arsenate reductase (glutaredoxin) [Pseudomonadota bacterium]
MSEFTIYHNPRCSKSRQTLAILEEHGIAPGVELYMESPPSARTLKTLLSKLGISAAQLVRRGEADYKAAGLSKESSEDDIVKAMTTFPKLIERPIVVRDKRAVLGRPPENVLDLID